ncbi:MAG: ATP-binding protein, partial [Burkholderiaceae bacterium]
MILKWPMAGSLRLRLAAVTLVTLSLALAGSYVLLTDLFRNHVLGQLDVTLAQQLDQLTAQLEFDATGTPQLNTSALLDPRWTKPYSGLYWQIDRLKQDGHLERGVLRSLWDTDLALPADALAGGSMHTHELSGPKGEALRVAERSLTAGQTGPTQW